MRTRLLASVTAAATLAAGVALVATPVTNASTPLSTPSICDPIDPAHCLLPFPNDVFTVADESTDSGRRVSFSIAAMPRNVAGKPVDPTEWNRNDGFSPGTPILARVPGLDLHETWGTTTLPERERDHIADLSRYAEAGAPILLVNAETGERHPFWSELDTHPQTTDLERLLIARPATNFDEGTRYLVVLRSMKDTAGQPIPAPASFAALRDDTVPLPPGLDQRRGDITRILGEVAAHEVARGNAFDPDDVYLAWEFTVASERNLAERILTMRDDAFGRILGDLDLTDRSFDGNDGTPPEYQITSTTPFDSGASLRRIDGVMQVPNYLDLDVEMENLPTPEVDEVALPGRRLHDGNGDGLPDQNPIQPFVDVPFTCHVPRTATAGNPADALLYGHGLLGSRGEANGGSTEDMRLRNFAICATDWWGMSSADLANVATILPDVSNFQTLVDRSHQGFLNKLFLARLMAHPDGLATDSAFHDAGGNPLVASGHIDYDGNSQGAIMGGSLVAMSPDFRRGNLGVPGMNYSTLLNRSVDWEGAYAIPFYAAYPSKAEQQILFALMQMLWDRAEANGYAHHMTDDPLANTPPHQIMLQVAFDDHQVANVSAEVEARTIGAALQCPALPDTTDGTGDGSGLHWSVEPAYGMGCTTFGTDGIWRTDGGSGDPVLGSVLVYFFSTTDRSGNPSGNGTPPNGNVPPPSGRDPHENPRRDNRGSDQKAHFFRTGQLLDTCIGPCVTNKSTMDN